MTGLIEGFAPVYDEGSELLVLGSFPSVKSRKINFYYGNPQNRFWRTVCGFFGESVPPSPEDKRAFVLRRKIALWDVVTACEIVGSADSSIKNEQIADLAALIRGSRIRAVFCNGTKAYELLMQHFPQYQTIAKKLPSTSPANPRFSADVWQDALREIFTDDNLSGSCNEAV